MIEKVKRLLRIKKAEQKEESDVSIDVSVNKELEELVKKAQKTTKESDEGIWDEFVSLCKEVGSDYREIIVKAAWKYIEDTGGAYTADPMEKAKEAVAVLKELDDTLRAITEPDSIKKVKLYTSGIKEVAELKKALSEIKSEKLSVGDVVAILKKLGVM